MNGLYRYVRNPMYAGVIITILGWACAFWSGWIFVFTIGETLAFHTFVVLYEEPRLQKLFGEEYCTYRWLVSRWIPRFPKV